MGKVRERTANPEERRVFVPHRESVCDACGLQLGRRAFIVLEHGKARCIKCAGLDHLVYLPAGHALLTRRASTASASRAVVLKWSRARKRYERQGLLVEAPALQAAATKLGLAIPALEADGPGGGDAREDDEIPD